LSIVKRRFATVRRSLLQFAARINIAVADRTEKQSNHAIWPLPIAALFIVISLSFGVYSANSQAADSNSALSAGTTDAFNLNCAFIVDDTLDVDSLNQTIGSLSGSGKAGNLSHATNITRAGPVSAAFIDDGGIYQSNDTTVATRFAQTDQYTAKLTEPATNGSNHAARTA
jgi:hypothetical protein